MTVKQILNIQEVSIENRKSKVLTIVNPKYIISKISLKVHSQVLGSIKDTFSVNGKTPKLENPNLKTM